jgi:hypothetical protein
VSAGGQARATRERRDVIIRGSRARLLQRWLGAAGYRLAGGEAGALIVEDSAGAPVAVLRMVDVGKVIS